MQNKHELQKFLALAREAKMDTKTDVKTGAMTPTNLVELAAKASDIDDLITTALNDPSCGSNPVPLNRQNLQRLFETAFDQ